MSETKVNWLPEGVPHTCPVCGGRGIVPGGFYTSTGDTWISSVATEQCRACCGSGVLWGAPEAPAPMPGR
jgi:hypothetical protein